MNGIGVNRGLVWPARLALVLCVGLVLARLGPFGTFGDLAAVPRFAYWIGLTLLMWLQSVAALALLRPIRLQRWIRLVLAALTGAVPTAFEVAWAEMLLRVQRDLGIFDILLIYGDVVLLAVPVLLVTHGLLRSPDAHSPTTPVAADDSWLMAQVRPDRRGRLLALESEDHYVRVITTGGSEMLHRRFGDLVTALGPALGCRVHRGWWVAKDAVRSQRREGDRIIITLIDGTEVPISRSYVVAAREAGLIAGG